MRYDPVRRTPRSELEDRAARLQKLMREKGLDGAVIVQNADLFYFAGTTQRSHLFIPAAGDPTLMVRKNLERALRESELKNIRPLANPKNLPGELGSLCPGRIGRLGFELDVLPANLYFFYHRLLGPVEIVDVSPLIRQVRAVKSPYELGVIRDVARLNHRMFSHVREFLREGMTEVDLASRLESVYRQGGHQCFIRMRGFNMEIVYGHLMSGWNLSVPSFFDGPTGGSGLNPSFPQGAGFKVINRDEPIMVDYVGVLDGYMVDQGRIFCIGRLPPRMEKAYGLAVEIQEMVKERTRPGASCSDIYESAVRIAGQNGLQDCFMGYPEPVGFIGHGVGIELDELPVLARGFDTPLAEGMVFALEPKFVFPEGAVGIENTLVVTPRGLENLTVFDEGIGYIS
ncbi:MAG: aminopeptidase P family protein [Firmicutes bacterium]|nr:aminopeptidase P family protein [Bacillota bacterium]